MAAMIMTGRDRTRPTSDRVMSKSRLMISVRRRLDEAVGEDEPARPDRGDEDLAGRLLVEGGPVLDPDAPQPALQEGLGREAAPPVDLGDDHDVRAGLLHQGVQVLDLAEQDVALRHHVGGARSVVQEPDDPEGPGAGRLELRR